MYIYFLNEVIKYFSRNFPLSILGIWVRVARLTFPSVWMMFYKLQNISLCPILLVTLRSCYAPLAYLSPFRHFYNTIFWYFRLVSAIIFVVVSLWHGAATYWNEKVESVEHGGNSKDGDGIAPVLAQTTFVLPWQITTWQLLINNS